MVRLGILGSPRLPVVQEGEQASPGSAPLTGPAMMLAKLLPPEVWQAMQTLATSGAVEKVIAFANMTDDLQAFMRKQETATEVLLQTIGEMNVRLAHAEAALAASERLRLAAPQPDPGSPNGGLVEDGHSERQEPPQSNRSNPRPSRTRGARGNADVGHSGDTGEAGQPGKPEGD